jgi:hypothetical protein
MRTLGAWNVAAFVLSTAWSAVAIAAPQSGASSSASQEQGSKAQKHKGAHHASQSRSSEPTRGAVPSANAAAVQAGRQANVQAVGEEAQQTNEQRAANLPDPKQQRLSADRLANDIGRVTTTAASVLANGVVDITQGADSQRHYSPFAIEINPLGLIVGGRWSLGLEWAPVTHNVIILSPHFVHTSNDVQVNGDVTALQTFTGAGGELGYRYYTGHGGMSGVFLGPSAIVGVYNAVQPNGNEVFTNVGVAFDVGAQWIFNRHFVVGAGVGIEYLNVSHDFHDVPTSAGEIASSGVKPRLLFALGYGF